MTRTSGQRIGPFPRQRRHTLGFLGEIRGFSPVFLDTDVDMTAVRAHRNDGHPYSTLTYVVYAASRVLAEHPDANAAMRGGLRPRIASFDAVHTKVTLDKTLDGRRVVLATVLRDTHRADLDEIQARIDHVKQGDPATMPEFASTRALQRLPWPLGPALFRAAVRPLPRRAAAMGTLAVTSLGHRPVNGFHSVGGTTVTLGLGQTAQRPVARGGEVVVAPVMRLNLAFDHRVIDGAEAADVLTQIRAALESFGRERGPGNAVAARTHTRGEHP